MKILLADLLDKMATERAAGDQLSVQIHAVTIAVRALLLQQDENRGEKIQESIQKVFDVLQTEASMTATELQVLRDATERLLSPGTDMKPDQ
ncbi:sigma-S stabilization anti-adapter protein IraP [Klebsiella aerogenes]|uniref:sigma-S stabilization anti-adapter protein IraP n=1 Tax=Klebsiella aerogenes TaxID=548 RepID=UPI0028DD960F|nr:sigma-S stabilization anti-adapter protein IraP [Klebsiella aerogenes]MDT8880968.1 sigma-S stabilization anti-adapter protein IraP [Klebsiella aerogenes]